MASYGRPRTPPSPPPPPPVSHKASSSRGGLRHDEPAYQYDKYDRDKYDRYAPKADAKASPHKMYSSPSVLKGTTGGTGEEAKYRRRRSGSYDSFGPKGGGGMGSRPYGGGVEAPYSTLPYAPKDDKYGAYRPPSPAPPSYADNSDMLYYRPEERSANSYNPYGHERDDKFGDPRHLKGPPPLDIDRESQDNYSGRVLQRYVVGDSVVYGSPGHYPKDVYGSSSPASKRPRSPLTPPPMHSSKAQTKSYSSRYSTSPKRYGSREERSSFSGRGKPPSPPPSYSSRDPISKYSPPLDRNKPFDDRYDYGKNSDYYPSRDLPPLDSSSAIDRDYDTYSGRRTTTTDPYYASSYPASSATYDDKYASGNTMAPPPLLSIPLSASSLPKESRMNMRETLGLPRRRSLNGVERPAVVSKGRRLEGRIGTKRKLSPSPKDRKKRRPDDLRLWIESRKTEGSRANGSVPKSGGGGGGGGAALRRGADSARPQGRGLTDARRRPMLKGKTKTGVRRDVTTRERYTSTNRSEGRRSLAFKARPSRRSPPPGDSKSGRRSRDRSDRGRDRRRRPAVQRPRVVSQANRLPLKQRTAGGGGGGTRQARRRSTSRDRDRNHRASNSDKYHSGKSRGHDRSRSRSRQRSPRPAKSRSRSASRGRTRSPLPPRPRSPSRSRSPRRS